MHFMTAFSYPFDEAAALEAFRAYAASRRDDDRDMVLQRLGPLIRILCTEMDRSSGGRFRADRDDLVQEVALHLWSVLGRVTVQFDHGGHFRAYFARAIRNRLITEIEKLNAVSAIPDGYEIPARTSEGSISEVEDRIFVEDVLRSLRERVLSRSRSETADPRMRQGVEYVVGCLLSLHRPRAMYLRYGFGISDPQFCLDYTRFLCRLELLSIWEEHNSDRAGHFAFSFIYNKKTFRWMTLPEFDLLDALIFRLRRVEHGIFEDEGRVPSALMVESLVKNFIVAQEARKLAPLRQLRERTNRLLKRINRSDQGSKSRNRYRSRSLP